MYFAAAVNRGDGVFIFYIRMQRLEIARCSDDDDEFRNLSRMAPPARPAIQRTSVPIISEINHEYIHPSIHPSIYYTPSPSRQPNKLNELCYGENYKNLSSEKNEINV